jgi:Protein of unknown function (DUF3318)
MVVARPIAAIAQELKRLKLSIPEPLQDAIDIELCTRSDRRLIILERIKDRRYQIRISLLAWQSLDIDLRNLLFWHEIARIQAGSIGSDRSEYIAIGVGLGIASIDLFAQNIGLLAASLLVAGLAGFRLYQKHIGERYLQRLTTADRDAIDLAVEFGYDREIAHELMIVAIQTTARKASKATRDRSAARLQVLSLSGVRSNF